MIEIICVLIWWIPALIVFGCIGYAAAFHDPYNDAPII